MTAICSSSASTPRVSAGRSRAAAARAPSGRPGWPPAASAGWPAGRRRRSARPAAGTASRRQDVQDDVTAVLQEDHPVVQADDAQHAQPVEQPGLPADQEAEEDQPAQQRTAPPPRASRTPRRRTRTGTARPAATAACGWAAARRWCTRPTGPGPGAAGPAAAAAEVDAPQPQAARIERAGSGRQTPGNGRRTPPARRGPGCSVRCVHDARARSHHPAASARSRTRKNSIAVSAANSSTLFR